MNNSYERYCHIRDKHGYRDSDVALGANVTKSTFSDWKAGRYTPKMEKLQKICDFLNISVEFLLTGEEKDGGETYYLNEETRDIAQSVFENKELKLLFDAARNAAPEDLQTIHSMLLALKRKERGEGD